MKTLNVSITQCGLLFLAKAQGVYGWHGLGKTREDAIADLKRMNPGAEKMEVVVL